MSFVFVLTKQKSFTERYGGEEVTPYIHVLVYHVGFYLERYGCLERFSNYSTESMHSQNKKVVAGASSGLGHQNGTAAQNICYQQLTYGFREEVYRSMELTTPEGPKQTKRKRGERRKNWATFGD